MFLNKIKKASFYIIFTVVILLLGISLGKEIIQEKENTDVIFQESSNIFGDLRDGDILIQEFEIRDAEEIKLGIHCATYGNTENNYGYLNLICENSNGELLKSEKIDIHSIRDNSNVYITIYGNQVSDGFIILKIIPDFMDPGTMITVYTTDYDDTRYLMSYNGIIQDCEIALDVCYNNSIYDLRNSFLYGIAVVLFIECLYYLLSYILVNNSFSHFLDYLKHVVFFLLAFVWIIVFNNGYYITENCISKIGIVFLIDILTHYIYQKDIVSLAYQRIIYIIGSIGISIVLGTGISFLFLKIGLIHYYSKMLIAFVSGSLLIAGLIVLFVKKMIKEENLLSLIVLIVGSVFAFSYPIATGVSWDDQIHYERSVVLSHISDDQFSIADTMLINSAYNGGAPSLLVNGTYNEFKDQIDMVFDSHEMIDYPELSIGLGTSIAYFPSALALFICRGLAMPYPYTFIIGRWINVAFYYVLILIAMKKLKSGKLIIFVISMFPTTLLLMSNYSYDICGIGIPIVAFSHYFGVMQDDDRQIGHKDIILMCLLLIIGYSAKPIYFCLVLSLLAVKRDKINPKIRKIYYIIVLLTAVLILLSFVAPYLLSGAGGGDMRGGTEVDSSGQVSYILHSPIDYSKTLLKFLWDYWSIKNAWGYMTFMAYMGNVSFSYPFIIFVLIIVILDKGPEDVIVSSAMARIWTLLMVFLASVWVATALYIAFTPVRATTINGCSPRYLLPLLFLLGYYISDYRIVKYIRKFISQRMLVITASIGMTVYALFAIYTRCISLY